MRKLFVLSSAVFFFASGLWCFAVDWGISGLNLTGAPSEIYIAWEVTTQYGDSSADPEYSYFAFANKDYTYMPIPQWDTPDHYLIDRMAMCVPLSATKFDYYRTIANKVNVFLSQVETDWLFYFTTQSGEPAQVTFRCIVNSLPDNTNVSVKLLTVDNEEFPITALTEGATCVVTLPPSTSPNSILAF